MSDRTGALATAACLLCLATGCGTERSLSDRDEAAAGQWSLSDEPLLRIGVVSGDEPYQMHDVRDAVRLPDGRIVVAHQGARQVRVYAPDGRFLIASGGDGDGPGEWRMISEVRPLDGDTLLAYGAFAPVEGIVPGAFACWRAEGAQPQGG